MTCQWHCIINTFNVPVVSLWSEYNYNDSAIVFIMIVVIIYYFIYESNIHLKVLELCQSKNKYISRRKRLTFKLYLVYFKRNTYSNYLLLLIVYVLLFFFSDILINNVLVIEIFLIFYYVFWVENCIMVYIINCIIYLYNKLF